MVVCDGTPVLEHVCTHSIHSHVLDDAHKRPVALTSETLFNGTCQGSDGGSHGGGGLLEVGGAIQGGSTLEVILRSSVTTEMTRRESKPISIFEQIL